MKLAIALQVSPDSGVDTADRSKLFFMPPGKAKPVVGRGSPEADAVGPCDHVKSP